MLFYTRRRQSRVGPVDNASDTRYIFHWCLRTQHRDDENRAIVRRSVCREPDWPRQNCCLFAFKVASPVWRL